VCIHSTTARPMQLRLGPNRLSLVLGKSCCRTTITPRPPFRREVDQGRSKAVKIGSTGQFYIMPQPTHTHSQTTTTTTTTTTTWLSFFIPPFLQFDRLNQKPIDNTNINPGFLSLLLSEPTVFYSVSLSAFPLYF
jgi:hypothetical protein